MTYKNVEIGKPTAAQIAEYIRKMGFQMSVGYVVGYYDSRNWLSAKGKPIKTLEAAINALNGAADGKCGRVSKKNHSQGKTNFGLEVKSAGEQRADVERAEMMGQLYEAYTDGSCDNIYTKAGGAGYIILKDGKVTKMKGKGFLNTTNNRMEMLAIISAVNSVPTGCTLLIYTDSQYCIKAFDGRQHTKNADLIEMFHKIRSTSGVSVCFEWVKGHDGNEYNEMADALAYSGYKEICAANGLKPSTKMAKAR